MTATDRAYDSLPLWLVVARAVVWGGGVLLCVYLGRWWALASSSS